jgi:hypothetical protein
MKTTFRSIAELFMAAIFTVSAEAQTSIKNIVIVHWRLFRRLRLAKCF